MARQVTVTLYQFDELSPKAKEKAREWYRESALDFEWWDSVYDDAKNIGLKITSFDLGRSNNIEGTFKLTANHVARAIMKDHGEGCETRKDAQAYLEAYEKAKGVVEQEDLGTEFLKTILDDYLDILRKEEEYITSDEQIDETIRANEYEFYEDGKRARTQA